MPAPPTPDLPPKASDQPIYRRDFQTPNSSHPISFPEPSPVNQAIHQPSSPQARSKGNMPGPATTAPAPEEYNHQLFGCPTNRTAAITPDCPTDESGKTPTLCPITNPIPQVSSPASRRQYQPCKGKGRGRGRSSASVPATPGAPEAVPPPPPGAAPATPAADAAGPKAVPTPSLTQSSSRCPPPVPPFLNQPTASCHARGATRKA